MLRSFSNTLVSVARVTEDNAGRVTAGVDGEVALTGVDRAALVHRVHQGRSWQALPVRRVYIPKVGTSSRLRPLGIPVVFDRVLQARVKNALEPEWEARFEPRSYGFRPGRGCHDAIESIFTTLCGNAKRLWILDADLSAAFDRIDHNRLCAALGSFPGRSLIRQWLKAGVIDRGVYTPTREGTPQGGVVSPVLMNVALHGMEEAVGVRYRATGVHAGNVKAETPTLVRYADDFIVACHSQRQAEQVKAQLAEWLAPRGLALNDDKTRIVHASEGFDFLGFNIRRYKGGKLLIKPSKTALRRIRQRLRQEFRAMRGAPPGALIQKVNQIIWGWSAYYRTVVSSKAFSALDRYVCGLALKWAKHRHPNKPMSWVTARYFGQFHPDRKDNWVFGDRDSGAYMRKFSWTGIVRHQIVTSGASPDDPTLSEYWATRRRRSKPPLADHSSYLLKRQKGRCPACGDLLLHADREPDSPQEWEQWRRTTRKAIAKQVITDTGKRGTPDWNTSQLVHTNCHRRTQTDNGSSTILLPA